MGVLILHGLANHRPPSHWQFQLAAALAADGVAVAYPSLPDADSPLPQAWDAAIEEHLAEVTAESGTPPDVVAHSLGVEAWLRRGPRTAAQVGRVLLVAPPGPAELAELAPQFPPAELFPAPAGWELWHSDADPYNAAGAASTHGATLVLPTREFTGGGHFTPAEGFGVWAAVLDWCRSGAGDPRAAETASA